MTTHTCRMCLEVVSASELLLLDSNEAGWWCDMCDSYNYFDPKEHGNHLFTIIYEDHLHGDTPHVEEAPINLRAQLSPFRYPGGKSRIIRYLSQYIRKEKSEVLSSPFCGGSSFELAMLEAGLVKKLKLNELDYGVYAVWWCILYSPDALIDRIMKCKPSHKAYFEAQSHIRNDYQHLDLVEAAWVTLFVNRLAYSGIAKANPLGGKYGSIAQLTSRWNPSALVRRIQTIHQMAPNIEISCMDACSFIEEAFWDEDSVLFIDPPYFKQGRALYNKYFQREQHLQLSHLLRSLHFGTPAADIIVTYDFHKELKEFNFKVEQEVTINRRYSI